MSRYKVFPSLVYTLSSSTFRYTYKSPDGPPFSPPSPSPLKDITDPLSTPAGTLIFIFLFFTSLPDPLQVGHSSSINSPLPPHSSHVPTLTNCPKGVCWAYLISPEPLHLVQVFTSVPGLAPDPSHVEHFSILRTCISFSTPNTASLNSRFKSYLKSLPLAGPDLLLPCENPPPNISNISPNISSN